jgi:uncharacterized membrane protein YgcG
LRAPPAKLHQDPPFPTTSYLPTAPHIALLSRTHSLQYPPLARRTPFHRHLPHCQTHQLPSQGGGGGGVTGGRLAPPRSTFQTGGRSLVGTPARRTWFVAGAMSRESAGFSNWTWTSVNPEGPPHTPCGGRARAGGRPAPGGGGGGSSGGGRRGAAAPNA